MSTTRTYAVGQQNTVRRLDNHLGPWVDVSIPVLPGTSAVTFNDVMSDPNNPDRVVTVGSIDPGNTGIMVSYDAGATWFKPGGNWAQGKILHEVWWVDSDVIWAVGEQGLVVKSIDGGLTFNVTPLRPGDGGVTFTLCIHALDENVAVVSGSLTTLVSDATTRVWKTIDGGASWVALNGGNPLTNDILPINAVGPPDGIWISEDQQEIIVGTLYTQNRTTNGGFNASDFTALPPEMTRSGKHLTWYPSHAANPTHFRHVGGPTVHVNTSSDGGATWSIVRSTEGIQIRGAHFYTTQLGYYTVGQNTFATSDGAVTGVISDPSVGVVLTAVWTGSALPIYCLEDCTDTTLQVYTDNPTLASQVGNIINADIDGFDSTICWQVTLYTGKLDAITLIDFGSVTDSFTDCESCLPDPDANRCWDLISCNGTCDDILSVSSFDFSAVANQLVYINGDTSCIYTPRAVRQAFFFNLDTNQLADPGGDFQMGLDDITIEISSIIHNGTEYVTGTNPSYLLTPINYQPLECTGLTCVNVAPNTTENSFENVPLFFNNTFTSLGVPLEAYPTDPDLCPIVVTPPTVREAFRIQYRDGDTFAITFSVTNNTINFQLLIVVNVGNITTQTAALLTTPTQIDTCNNDVFCPTVLQPAVTSVNLWGGECPPLPAEPPIPGEACEIVPRLGEPGFSVKNCDPKKVVDIKHKYADSVYAWFKRMRFGIETCCEFDMDKIDIKNMLLDLGAIYDPGLCDTLIVIPDDCCPAATNAVATVLTSQGIACPPATNAVAILTTEPVVPACPAPTALDGSDSITTVVTIG